MEWRWFLLGITGVAHQPRGRKQQQADYNAAPWRSKIRARTRRGFTCVRSDKASVGPACNHGNVEQQCQRSRYTDLAITASSKHGEEGRKEGPGHREGATGEEAAVVFMAGATQTELRQGKNALPCLDGRLVRNLAVATAEQSQARSAFSARLNLRHAQRRTWSSLR